MHHKKLFSAKTLRPITFFSNSITLTGASAVGTTSTLEAMRDSLGHMIWRYVSVGAIMRRMGRDLHMSRIEDFLEYVKSHPEMEYDKCCDSEIIEYGKQNHCLFEGRLPHVFVPRSFHVLIECPLSVRAERRHNHVDYSHMSVGEVAAVLEKRDADDTVRFEKLYPGCIWKREEYDFTASTEIDRPEKCASSIISAFNSWSSKLKEIQIIRTPLIV